MKRALFLDRDGTLVEARHYPSHPSDLVLNRDVGPLLHTFQQVGWELIVITNQSGIARGYFTEEALEQMHNHLRAMFRGWDVELDGIYACPHHVDGVIPHLAIRCDCRKPRPGMLLTAAGAREIDLASSWMIGDILDDIEAGNRAGCRTALVDLGTEPVPARPERWPTLVAPSTAEALRAIAAREGLPPFERPLRPYQPARWEGATVVQAGTS